MTAVHRPYHHGHLRSALVDAAIEEVRERGVPAVSLRSVATRAGVSEAAPYHHFRGKADLLSAAAAVAFASFAEALSEAVAAAELDGTDPATAVAAAYVEHGLGHPGEYQLMFGRHIVSLGIDQRIEAREAGGRAALISLEAVDQSLRQRGISVPLDTAFSVLWAMFHGIVTLVSDQELAGVTLEYAVEMAVDGADTLLRGWSHRPPTPAGPE